MQFGQLTALALHEGMADGVTELHLSLVARQLLKDYKPAEGNFPTEVLFQRKAWAARQLRPILDEVGVTFEESLGTVDLPADVRAVRH
jgi:acyl-CoA dehydrogenase